MLFALLRPSSLPARKWGACAEIPAHSARLHAAPPPTKVACHRPSRSADQGRLPPSGLARMTDSVWGRAGNLDC
eukprot:364690-Chlamydomonas_euryale.AAC.7